jgi:hypothetical protein
MVYYRVKPEADQKHKNPKIHDGNVYISGEIYTAGEVERQKLNPAHLEKINVKKTETYWCFGARFTHPHAKVDILK